VVRLEDSAEVHLCTVDLPRDPMKDQFTCWGFAVDEVMGKQGVNEGLGFLLGFLRDGKEPDE